MTDEEEQEDLVEEEDEAINTIEPEVEYKAPMKSTSDYNIKEFTASCEFGELMCFFPNSEGDYQIVIGTFWYPYAVVTLIYFIINVYFYFKYSQYLSSIIFKIGLGLYITSLISSLRVFLSNPGVPNTKTNHQLLSLDDNDRAFCEKCNVWTDNRGITIHCRSCNCCIDDYEQHSVFFCKCIGKGNYISHNIFMVTNLLSLAFIILIKGLTH